jgi:hypothetical protein
VRLIRVACGSFVSSAIHAAASLTIFPSWLHLDPNQSRSSASRTAALDGALCDPNNADGCGAWGHMSFVLTKPLAFMQSWIANDAAVT